VLRIVLLGNRFDVPIEVMLAVDLLTPEVIITLLEDPANQGIVFLDGIFPTSLTKQNGIVKA